MFHLAQRKDYMMVETRPVGPGLCCFVCLVWCWVSLFLSPPSDCSSLPSMMTWAPCPHGVRTRGKKISNDQKPLLREKSVATVGAHSFLFCAHRSISALFFHECGRRAGMVPRSSLKEGKNRQMVEKGTKTPKPTQTKHPSPQAETPPSCSLSSTLGETCETETSGN